MTKSPATVLTKPVGAWLSTSARWRVVKKISRTTTDGYNGTWDEIENPDFPRESRWPLW
jgi:hypothetical protein